MDRILTGNDADWLVPFIVGLSALAVIQVVAAWIKAIYSLKIDGKMAIVGNMTYMWKVLRLPMKFFSQRMAGDIQQRQASNADIAGTLVNTLSPLVLETLMLVFYLVVMVRYSPLLTFVGVASILGQLWVSRIISNKRVNITRVMMRDSGKLAAATVSGIDMIETIKASGAENGYFEKWSGYQASVNTQNVRFMRINSYLGLIPPALTALANDLVLVLGNIDPFENGIILSTIYRLAVDLKKIFLFQIVDRDSLQRRHPNHPKAVVDINLSGVGIHRLRAEQPNEEKNDAGKDKQQANKQSRRRYFISCLHRFSQCDCQNSPDIVP
jgi:ABC-type bacteriocin/lantibiotic exporter with double-glycine peptidase domain